MRTAIVFAIALIAFQRVDSQGGQTAAAFKIKSTVGELRVAPTTRLPANPKPKPVQEYCSSYAVAHPRTPGGRLAQRNGWIVTSETRLGTYDAVTFIAALADATSSTCFHVKGNLGIFDGPRLKAIVYRPRSPQYPASQGDNGVEDSLGSAEQVNARRIRLLYGMPVGPFADVVLRDGISIEPIAKEDPVCGGAAAVPNVFGEDIRRARKTLRAYGWRPVRPPADDPMFGGEDLLKQGVIEVKACSGTGYGFCGFDYRHKRGFSLSVGTMGEEYGVIDYSVGCSRLRRHRTGR